MFDNLVESGSHKEDVTRKGSFILVTLAVYFVLIVAGGIAGIMFATANIDQQTLELTALIAPVPVPQQQKKEAPKPEKVDIDKNVDVRRELIATVDRADLVPKTISAKASDVPPVRKRRGDDARQRRLECGRADRAGKRHWPDHFRPSEGGD